MSSFDRLRVLGVLGALLGLTGCFQPLYGEAANPGLSEKLREVKVEPIKERIGAYLADDLVTRMNGTGETPTPKYKLVITVNQSVQTPTVESQIGIATSATVMGTASFLLTKIEGGKLIYRGTAVAFAPYDRTLQNYSNLRAARDSELRIARSLSEEIELRVAAALGAEANADAPAAKPTPAPGPT